VSEGLFVCVRHFVSHLVHVPARVTQQLPLEILKGMDSYMPGVRLEILRKVLVNVDQLLRFASKITNIEIVVHGLGLLFVLNRDLDCTILFNVTMSN